MLLESIRRGLPPQTMQKHFYPPRALLDRGLFRRVPEPECLHRFEKDRRFVAAGVGEERLPAGCEELGYQVGEGCGVLALVEHVGGEDEVEGSKTTDVRRAPVEEGRAGFRGQVSAGVVGGEVEGGLVMVRGEYGGAPGERDDGGQPDAAPKLDSSRPIKVAFREVARQGDGARPELRPVGEPFVAVEVVLVDQVVRRDGVRDLVSCVADLDGSL